MTKKAPPLVSISVPRGEQETFIANRPIFLAKVGKKGRPAPLSTVVWKMINQGQVFDVSELSEFIARESMKTATAKYIVLKV